jgi:3-oxoacyl-[acyl-carrier protein] reductase
MAPMTLNGKTAVVTGAAGTMGLAAVRMFLEEGAKVALVDIDAMRLDGLARFLRGPILAVPCDVSDAHAVRQALQQVEQALGPADILLNNAAIPSSDRAESTSESEWRRVMATNLDGAFMLARGVLPAMKKQGWGRIVNVSSLAAKTGGLAGGAAYAASKGGLASLTFALARECASFGVTVNAIAPAYVKTAATAQLNESQQRQILAQIPVGRFCEPEEFAHAVRFLCSPLSGFITGEVLDMNGGLVMD